MYLRKILFLLSVLCLLALFTLGAEAKKKSASKKKKSSKHRHHSWRDSVHFKCKQSGEYTLVVGNEKITDKLIRVVLRAVNAEPPVPISVALNGRSLRKSKNSTHNWKRNVAFVKAIADKAPIVVLPYGESKGKSVSRRARNVVKQLKLSAKYLARILKANPLTAYLSKDITTKRIVKKVVRAGFIPIAHTTQMAETDQKHWKRSSLIITQTPSEKGIHQIVKEASKHYLKMVNLVQCLGEGVYKGGEEEADVEAEGGDIEAGEEGDDDISLEQ